MWFIFITAYLFIGGLLIPRSRDPQYGYRVALVNSLIASGGTSTRVVPASLAHTTPSSATAECGEVPAWWAEAGAVTPGSVRRCGHFEIFTAESGI